jgi:hypothetical protein
MLTKPSSFIGSSLRGGYYFLSSLHRFGHALLAYYADFGIEKPADENLKILFAQLIEKTSAK